MTILIANIGTSDLAVKVDDYYLPIGFDRDEPNIDESDLNTNEKEIWEKDFRKEYIIERLCKELNVDIYKGKFKFRELTEKILNAYQNNPAEWHQRISLGRIYGVIKTAIEKFNVKKVYIFVTDQLPKIIDTKTEQEIDNRGYDTDSVNLFNILKIWLSQEQESSELSIFEEKIPQDLLPIEQDKLLNYYYRFFLKDEIKNEDNLLISAKGGTPQMLTALKVQALASSNQYQLFIDPQLSVKKVLIGEASQCVLTSYWQYMKGQKYNDVINLLENRWDFLGAIEIMEKWKDLLNFLAKNIDDSQLKNNQNLISNIIKTLRIASECFNLDIEEAKNITKDKDGNFLKNLQTKLQDTIVKKYNSRLNLYTQCRIYNELGQSAYLLSRMASFYDSILEQIARDIGCYNNSNYPQTGSRYEKRNYLSENINNEEAWNSILNNLKKLDFWYDKRNSLIHSATGISPNRLKEVYQKENQQNQQSTVTCPPNQIVNTMGEILTTSFNLIYQEDNKFVEKNAEYYIYSTAKDWVIEKLQNDLKN